jgi:hypothetical protein
MANDEVVNRVFSSVIDQLKQQTRKSRYLNDPTLWAKDVLGIDLWSKQQDVLAALVNNDHTAVRSAHGTGKSLLASVIACWWVATRPLGDAIVVTTAPTYAQVHNILWEEIRKHHIRAAQRYADGLSPMKLPGYITQSDEWKSDDGVLLGFGRKPADNNDHGFQGIHRRYVLVLVDESCGIKENLFTAVEAITTTENSRILAIGNPDDPATYFNKMFTKDVDIWAGIDISSFDSPNFTKDHAGHFAGCDDPQCFNRRWAERWERDKEISVDLLPLLPNKGWVEERRAQWGEGSALWMSKVLGEFPLQSVNALFSRDTLNKGHDTIIKPLSTARVVLGVDLSRFGPNYSTIYKYEEGVGYDPETDKPNGKSGGRVRLVDKWGGKADETEVDGMESAARVHQWAQSLGAAEVRIDAEGVGGPILDQIRRLSDNSYDVIAMRGSAASPDNYRWVNARGYWYDSMRERMMNYEIDIDPNDAQLETELEQIQYHFKNRYSSLQIEAKEDMERRGVASPDFSDAAVYAAADMSYVTSNPLSRFQAGDKFAMSAQDFLGLTQNGFFISPL